MHISTSKLAVDAKVAYDFGPQMLRLHGRCLAILNVKFDVVYMPWGDVYDSLLSLTLLFSVELTTTRCNLRFTLTKHYRRISTQNTHVGCTIHTVL